MPKVKKRKSTGEKTKKTKKQKTMEAKTAKLPKSKNFRMNL